MESMKEIESLIKDIDACISDRNSMIQKKKELKLDVSKVILINYESFFKTEVKRYEDVLNSIHNKGIWVKDRLKDKFAIGDKWLEVYSDGYNIAFRYQYSNISSFGWEPDANCVPDILSTPDKILNRSENWFAMMNTFFGSEEKTLATLAFIRQFVVKVLQSMHDYISVKNTELAESLDKLREVVSNSRSIETKEDGTIEIMLGGKTYIGTVKEQ